MQERQTKTPTTADFQRQNTRVHPDPTEVIAFVAELASHYELTALDPLLQVCHSAAAATDLNIAIFGRFKAGKSSFLNHFVGRDLLPVGVVPVTTVITELHWGPQDGAEVHFLDDRVEPIQLERVGEFIAESQNPENRKGVRAVCVRVPELALYKGLRFIDTPGLESGLAHNTEASLAWAPNVDLALVAVGVDPPLSEQDLTLIRKLFEYTPKICILLTKVDVLSTQECDEVLQFVRTQLNRNFSSPVEVFPYSIRAGFEGLRANFKARLVDPALETIREQKEEIVHHKIQTLLRECGDYVQLTLRAAEMMDDEKRLLQNRVFDEKEVLSDTGLELRLVAQHSIGLARSHVEKTLAPFERNIQTELRNAFDDDFPAWRLSFGQMLERFDAWLRNALTSHLTLLSASQKPQFLKPLLDVQRQYLRVLQSFRDGVSAQIVEIFGFPLRTTETEIEPESPKAPDVNVGHVFDHNWELLSRLIPMSVFRHVVKTRFQDRVDHEVTKNLSRFTTQWADILIAAITSMQREAERRLRELVKTVECLTAASADRAPEIRSDLQKLRHLEAGLKR